MTSRRPGSDWNSSYNRVAAELALALALSVFINFVGVRSLRTPALC